MTGTPENNVVLEQLLRNQEILGGAMDYKRLNGCWVSERKYGALINRVDIKSSAVSHNNRPKACTKTPNGFQLKVNAENIDEGRRGPRASACASPRWRWATRGPRS